ncbi:hypothetical protein LZ554_001915 [Drepanopeziza brunnea f. sp. 'monogermtubi']|nr:hypothetical protein LZ554_001915 [Drepanopeziza brunnea f. sp. 'monogermtubi']
MSDFTNNHHDDVVPSIENDSSSTTNGLQSAKDAVVNNAAAAADAVKNHPLTQSVANGPVVENIKDQTTKTSNEFSNLAASRATPSTPAATGQPLTHYHSFFSSLLSWENPRASGIAYLVTVLFIFSARYLDIIRYSFKLTYMTLGITVLAEVLGKALISNGLTSQIRPKKYYTVSKESLNSLIGDVHELINFFVIEAQQIVFAENVFASGAAFIAAFISYYLIKVVPFWGLSLIATSVLFLVPLIYNTNKELIDENLARASSVINQQTEQVKTLASQQAARATETTKTLVGDYSAKAQGIIGRNRSVSPVASAKPAKTESLQENTPAPAYKSEDFPVAPQKSEFDFPAAPKEEFKAPVLNDEPLIST